MKAQSILPEDPTEKLKTLSSLEDFTSLRKLHNLGANLSVLINGNREKFIDNLPSTQLQRLFLSSEIIQNSGTLDVVINQLSKCCLGYRVHACRGESKHEMKDHKIWSSGLIEAETENDELIDSIREVLGLEEWHNRHEVLCQSPENYLVLTLQSVGLNTASVLDFDVWPGGDMYSANIASELKLLTIPAWAIERVIGCETLSGNELLGIGSLSQNPDISFDSEIFERLKVQIAVIQAQRELNNN